jgi:hypothetical protein
VYGAECFFRSWYSLLSVKKSLCICRIQHSYSTTPTLCPYRISVRPISLPGWNNVKSVEIFVYYPCNCARWYSSTWNWDFYPASMIRSLICCWFVIFFSGKVKIIVKVTTVFLTTVLRMCVGSACFALLARNISWSVPTMHCGCDWLGPWVRVIGSQSLMNVMANRKYLPFLLEIEFRTSIL